MNTFVIEIDTEIGKEEPVEVLVHGPYANHMRANSAMQSLFDQIIDQ